jgi:hypothetical protein
MPAPRIGLVLESRPPSDVPQESILRAVAGVSVILLRAKERREARLAAEQPFAGFTMLAAEFDAWEETRSLTVKGETL